MLAVWMSGKSGNWTVPNDVGEDYLKQLTAEQRLEETDARGRKTYRWTKIRNDDHYRDCELMILTAMVITRVVGREDNPSHDSSI
jgi:hypothetical protein